MAPRLAMALILGSALFAQGQPTFMQIGNVVHGYGGGMVALLDTGLQTATPLQIVPAGLGAGKFTWDAQNPDDLLVWASDGHIYRSTVGAGGVNAVQLTQQNLPGTAGVVQLTWDQTGNLIAVGNTLGGQIFAIDPVSGAVTTLLSWPFASSIRCGQQDPATGDWYLGNNQGIWRVSGVLGGTPSVLLVHASSSPVVSLTFDPSATQFLVFIESADLRRLDKTTLAVENLFTGAPPTLDMVRMDEQGGLLGIDGRHVYRVQNPDPIPMGGIIPVPLGSNLNIGCCFLNDVVMIGESFTPFRLQITSQPGGAATIEIINTPLLATSTWMFWSTTTLFPVNAGPFLGIFPDAFTVGLIAALPTPQPGNFLHSLGAPPSLVVLPPGSMSFVAGQTWDAVIAAFGPLGAWWGRTNVARVTWQ